jgi:rubrerythrin
MRLWRGYGKKVTPELKEEIERLRSLGFSINEIARNLGLAVSTVQYHLFPEYREQAKERARRRTKPTSEKKKLYTSIYLVERYHSDPEFRKRFLLSIKSYREKLKERNEKLWRNGDTWQCPYCSHRWTPRSPTIFCPKCRHTLAKPPIITPKAE